MRLDDGAKERCVVRIPRKVANSAWNEPGLCAPGVVEAVMTQGRSVVEKRVWRNDDPPLHWVVHVDVIVEDDAPPEE